MTYPYEAGEAERFVPAAFAGADNPPTFWLRWATPREKRAFRRLLELEGLRQHDVADQREELIKGMKDKLTPEEFAKWQPRAKEYWDSSDDHAREVTEFRRENPGAKRDEWPKFELDGADEVVAVLDQIGRDWPAFRMMMADNREMQSVSPDLINAVIIERYENLPVRADMEGRHLSYLCAATLAEALDKEGRKIKREPGVLDPVSELYIETMKRYALDKEAEKNSPSPPPSSRTPTDTKGNGEASTAGKSKASATSKKTPAGS